jgi:hypothetical protein
MLRNIGNEQQDCSDFPRLRLHTERRVVKQGVTSLPRVFDTTNYAQVDKFACEEFRSHVIVQKYERIGHRQNTLIEITKCGAARMIA